MSNSSTKIISHSTNTFSKYSALPAKKIKTINKNGEETYQSTCEIIQTLETQSSIELNSLSTLTEELYPNAIHLTPEQRDIFENFKRGNNIFMTGPGGCGKTFLIHHLHKWCIDNYKQIQVCALTGCAAVLLHCQAKTIHSWAGIGLANGNVEDVIHRVVTSKYKKRNWGITDVLIIDEVSMMSHKLLSILDGIARRIKNPRKPFGGMQIVFSGDFYQLPPVGDKDDNTTQQFCFENPIWDELFHNQIELKHVFRQENETYANILNQIREGTLTKTAYNMLQSRCISWETEQNENNSGIRPTKLLPRRVDVNKINETEMNSLDGEIKIFTMKEVETTPTEQSMRERILETSRDTIMKEKEALKNSIMAEKSLTLKINSQVMCIANIDNDDVPSHRRIVNGSRGVVVAFTPDKEGLPIVKFRSGFTRVINPYIWESESLKGIGIQQLPLMLAWAITIHKAQGATLDLAEIDIGNGIFECGQTYVALSRVKDISGLYLSSFNPQKIKIHKKVKDYYQRFRK
jgi:ATP-dependent DNA helicase PIF1